MRKHWIHALAIVAVVTFSAAARAADEPVAEKGGKKSEERRSELFDKLDANHDGQITADEVPEEQRRLFNRLLRQNDGDHDGKLSRAEFLGAKDDVPPANADAKSSENSPNDRRPEVTPGQRPLGGGMGPGQFGSGQFMMGIALLHALDTNGDGVLDASEIAAATASLKKLDTNSDGEISRDELRAAVPPAMMENLRAGLPGTGGGAPGGNPEAAMARLMTQFDTNKDGKLEKSELPPRLQEQFDELDRNHDGSLDENETRAILPRLIRRMENGNQQAGKDGALRRRLEGAAEKKADEK
jgi:Ca2+-binding EF-hand superfamily protein